MRCPIERRKGSWCAALLLFCCLPACTLIKPIVGAVTGPFVMLGGGGGSWNCGGCGDGCGAVLLALSGIGIVGGLVTGAISDFNVVTGRAIADPTANWWDPFATNRSR